jgi:hypothetical protein
VWAVLDVLAGQRPAAILGELVDRLRITTSSALPFTRRGSRYQKM